MKVHLAAIRAMKEIMAHDPECNMEICPDDIVDDITREYDPLVKVAQKQCDMCPTCDGDGVIPEWNSIEKDWSDSKLCSTCSDLRAVLKLVG